MSFYVLMKVNEELSELEAERESPRQFLGTLLSDGNIGFNKY